MRALAIILSLVISGCHADHDDHADHDHHADHDDHADHDHHADHDQPGQTLDHELSASIGGGKVLEVPESVRRTLGIRFHAAEIRAVGRTLRLAGHFAVPPSARGAYHAALPGTVTLKVKLLEEVKAGQLLATIASPELLEQRHHLHQASDAVGTAEDLLRIATQKVTEANSGVSYQRRRVRKLEKLGTKRANLSADLAALERSVPVLKAEKRHRANDVVRANHRYEAELSAFASRVEIPRDTLTKAGDGAAHGQAVPLWETIGHLEVRARGGGIVSAIVINTGSWAGQGERLLEFTERGALWLEARALNTDLGRLSENMTATVHPSGVAGGAPAKGTVRLGVSGDRQRQTFPVYVELDTPPQWARSGVAAFAELLNDAVEGTVAVPTAAIIRDGLKSVVFVQDDHDPDHVQRVEVTAGVSDGRWTVVDHGIAPGDRVAVEGAYELKLAANEDPKQKKGVHVHSDGSVHQAH